jgi:hypothetical protein
MLKFILSQHVTNGHALFKYPFTNSPMISPGLALTRSRAICLSTKALRGADFLAYITWLLKTTMVLDIKLALSNVNATALL